MSREKRDVTVCDGLNNGEKCDRVFNKGGVCITLTLRAVRSDMPRDQYVGMERYHAERKAGLRKEVHIHPSCLLSPEVVGQLLVTATATTEWPELAEDD